MNWKIGELGDLVNYRITGQDIYECCLITEHLSMPKTSGSVKCRNSLQIVWIILKIVNKKVSILNDLLTLLGLLLGSSNYLKNCCPQTLFATFNCWICSKVLHISAAILSRKTSRIFKYRNLFGKNCKCINLDMNFETIEKCNFNCLIN